MLGDVVVNFSILAVTSGEGPGFLPTPKFRLQRLLDLSDICPKPNRVVRRVNEVLSRTDAAACQVGTHKCARR